MTEQTKLRGFAAMTPDRRREIARLGGRSIPADKRYYARNREAAANAGKKGGKALPKINANDLKFLAEVVGSEMSWEHVQNLNRAGRNRVARLLELGALVYDHPRDFVVPAPLPKAEAS